MTFSPVRGLIVLLLFSNVDAGKLLNLFYSVLSLNTREAESPERTALSVFGSSWFSDGPPVK